MKWLKKRFIAVFIVSFLLVLSSYAILTSGATITETFFISNDTVLLIGGENYTIHWIPDDKIVCINEKNKTISDPECSKTYINKSIDKTKTTTIIGNVINLDKSYRMKLKNGLTYEIMYVDKQKTKCKCYKTGSCAIMECYPQPNERPSGIY